MDSGVKDDSRASRTSSSGVSVGRVAVVVIGFVVTALATSDGSHRYRSGP